MKKYYFTDTGLQTAKAMADAYDKSQSDYPAAKGEQLIDEASFIDVSPALLVKQGLISPVPRTVGKYKLTSLGSSLYNTYVMMGHKMSDIQPSALTAETAVSYPDIVSQLSFSIYRAAEALPGTDMSRMVNRGILSVVK